MENHPNKDVQTWLSSPISFPKLKPETLIFAIIVLLAIFSRFYDLESRVMSHDESLHTYFSWQLYKGNGFQHTPLMHGPLQFHLLSWTYSLFGDNDFTARIPAVLFSIATVAFIWNFKRYIGKTSTLVTAALFLISPFMLYYGRYVRNDSFVIFFGVVSFWAILRYLDSGENKFLYYLTFVTVLHFAAKETSFIYLAQMLVFLGLIFLRDIFQRQWVLEKSKKLFFNLLLITGIVFGLSAGIYALEKKSINETQLVAPLPVSEGESEIDNSLVAQETSPYKLATFGVVGLGGILFMVAFVTLVKGYGENNLRRNRSFGMMVLYLSLILPHLSALLINAFTDWDPMDYTSEFALVRIAVFVIPLFIISGLSGKWWNWKEWLINNAIFYSVFIILFTTVFTNGSGFFSGLVGSLGYWLIQQGVERGSQPFYYYLLVQLPIYEFLPLVGVALAAYFGKKKLTKNINTEIDESTLMVDIDTDTYAIDDVQLSPQKGKENAWFLFWFWAITSILAYTIAGEKMPWLTIHISLPLILLAGWSIGRLIEKIDWQNWKNNNGWFVFIAPPLFFFSILKSISGVYSLFTSEEPGKTLTQLETFSTVSLAIIFTLLLGYWLIKSIAKWERIQVIRVIIFSAICILSIQTIRASVMATYINYDQATEYLVYAHGARGVKDVMDQVESISRRTTDGLALNVAFDNDVSWPMTWYLRNYPNQIFYGESPSKDLRNSSVIIVGDNNFLALDPIVGQGYHKFEYIRMWWPNQDYFNIDTDKVKRYLSSPDIINGLFQIWLNRDYKIYGLATGTDFTLPNWSPADKMRLYIRKDMVSQLWDYGVSPSDHEIVIDPYEEKLIFVPIDRTIGDSSQLNGPRDIEVANDGSIYVADSRNHRIVHFDSDGNLINQFGSPSIMNESGSAAQGTFNEPWGIALSPENDFLYVADTWNHRIQKFSADGEFITMWGYFEQLDDPFAFWGPRDITVGPNGNLFVSNTGNKRIVIFSPEGEFITQFGELGFSPGQFDEPVGIAIDNNTGFVYVADTWNQRIQVFKPDDLGNYIPHTDWEILAWSGNTLENKPYIEIDENGFVYVGDPELSRILVFTSEGEFVNMFADENLSLIYGYPMGISSDHDGGLWISDSKDNQIIHLILP